MSGSSLSGSWGRLCSVRGGNGIEWLRGEVEGRRAHGSAFWHSERLAWLVRVEAHDGAWHALGYRSELFGAMEYLRDTIAGDPLTFGHTLEAVA